MNFFKLTNAIKMSWGKDTAYREDAEKWSSDNPSIGQCAVTALIINDFYGGKIYSGISKDGITHFWNKIYGIKIDLTKNQFKDTKKFTDQKQWEKDELMNSGNVQERYKLLKRRVDSYLAQK